MAVATGMLGLLFIGPIFILFLGLQFLLSRTRPFWPGLILPLLTALYSLMLCVNLTDAGDLLQNLLAIFTVLLLGNIPTVLLLAIYYLARRKYWKKNQLEKMRAQDLE